VVPSDQSQQQFTPETPTQQPVEVNAKVEESPPEGNEEKAHTVPPPAPAPVTSDRPEERRDKFRPQQQNPQAIRDDPLRSHPQAEKTQPVFPQSVQNRSTQPQSPANNGQYIRQQGRSSPHQQRQQEKPSGISYFWKSITGDD